MNDREPQRVAVVTSGAVRVGRAISLALANAGYDLVIVYRSSEQEAREVRQLVAKMEEAPPLGLLLAAMPAE